MSHVDSTSPVTHVSLCAGYGGIDLGLSRAIPSLRTIAFSEIEAFACANLVSKMEAGLLDAAPIWTDLKTFPWAEFHGRVDILSGGYPCQPFSAAGKRLGAEDPRHLWPYISAGIAAMRPGACFFENVEGHISLGLPDVIEDLAGMGYRTTWCVASASECGAPHQRKRVFILAHRASERGEGESLSRWISQGNADLVDDCGDQAWPSRPGEQQYEWEPPRVVGTVPTKLADFCSRDSQSRGDTAQAGGESTGERRQGKDAMSDRGSSVCGGDQEAVGNANELRPQGRHDTGSLQAMGISRAELTGANGKHHRGPAKSSLGGDTDGLTHRLDHAELHVTTDNRTDELRLLGNGVVPATAERAFRVLVGELMEATK